MGATAKLTTAGSAKWLTGLSRDATVGDAARQALQLRISATAARLPLAASRTDEDIEHVHQLRVLSRRTVAALTTFKAVLPGKSREKLVRCLREVRKAADAARDLDVFLLRLRERTDTPEEFLASVKDRRRKAQSPLRAVCRKFDSGKKLRRTGRRLLDKTPASGKSASLIARLPLAEWAPHKAAKEAERFFAAAPDGSTASWHVFRIAGKRLRYTIELLAESLPVAIKREAYPRLTELQQRLGEMNDHATAIHRLSRWQAVEDQEFLRQLIKEENKALKRSQKEWRSAIAAGEIEQLREALLRPLS